MKFRPTDQQAWEAHASGMTWADVARLMHFANGSVARRAALRYATTVGATEPEPTPDVAPTPNVASEPEEPAPNAPSEGTLGDVQVGDLLYHQATPRAKFKFVKWNRDGSAQVWGGEVGHPAYRDFLPSQLSRVPSDDMELIFAYAKRNLFVVTTIDLLVEQCGVSRANARKAVQTRPDIFRRLSSRSFEIRDPLADRTADKAMVS